jgi:probable phosphoglycerate mutase
MFGLMSEPTTSYAQTLYQPEPGACQILLIRHGQSEPFVPGRPFPLIGGHGDPHLTNLGHYQAELVADRLGSEPIRAIYASNLTRTSQTAAPLARILRLETRIESDLREIYLGEFEGGLLRQRSAENHPAVTAMRAKGEWGELPGAETNAQFTRRTVAAVERIAASHADQLVAVFCHGGVIGSLLGHAAGVNPFTFNGSRHTAISHVVLNPSGWVIRAFNDGAHAGRLTTDHQLPANQ